MRLPGQDGRGIRFGLACSMLLACLLMTGGCYRSYVCESGKTLKARGQMDGERVIIDVGDGDITLQRVPAASGEKYSDGRRTVWFEGDALTVEADGKSLHGRCVRAK